MSRLSLCITMLLLMFVTVTGAAAGEYTFTLDGLLNRADYTPGVSQQLDMGMKFSDIQSIKLHVAGTAYYNTFWKENWPYTIGFRVGTPFNGYPDVAGFLNYPGFVGQTAFDMSGTWNKGFDPAGDMLLSELCDGTAIYSFYFTFDNGSTYGSGWLDADTATITVNGTPVPEPSTFAGLLFGLMGTAGLGWRIRRP